MGACCASRLPDRRAHSGAALHTRIQDHSRLEESHGPTGPEAPQWAAANWNRTQCAISISSLAR